MSGELEIIDSNAFQTMERVAELHVKSVKPMTIAKALGMKTVEVKAAIEQWKTVVANDRNARDAAAEHLDKMVAHYDLLIAKSHDNLEDLDALNFDEKVSAQKNATLKNIADFEAKRVDTLQKAGLLDATDLGDELAEREEREAFIFKILRDELCPDCRAKVMVAVKKFNEDRKDIVVYEDHGEQS